MNRSDMETRVLQLFRDAADLLTRKGKDYAPSGSAFEGFNEIALMSDCTREKALWILLSKHLVTIRGGTSTTEAMRQRILDAINYLAILESMLSEPTP